MEENKNKKLKIKVLKVDIGCVEFELDWLLKNGFSEFIYHPFHDQQSYRTSDIIEGKITEKDGILLLKFEDPDMRDDIEVDSEIGREILSMSEF